MNKCCQVALFVGGLFAYRLGLCETQLLTMSEGQRLEANIAQDSMNRLMVSQDRILNIFGDEGSFVTQSDEQTGQIFIKPTVENGLKPLSLTLITENGVTQDLTLTPSPIASATLILKPSSGSQTTSTLPQDLEPSVESMNKEKDKVSFSQQGVALIKQAILGELKPVSPMFASHRSVSGYQTRFLKAYQAGEFKISVWSVKKLDPALTHQEKAFYQSGDLALCLRKENANEGKKFFLYVLTKG